LDGKNKEIIDRTDRQESKIGNRLCKGLSLWLFIRGCFCETPSHSSLLCSRQYPRGQKWGSHYAAYFFKTARWIRIALHAFKNSIANTMLNFNKDFAKTEVEKA
jgi:hypothetical protein